MGRIGAAPGAALRAADVLLQTLLVADRQLVTTFGTTASQHLAAVLAAHARTETVLVGTLAAGRLERSFHRWYLLNGLAKRPRILQKPGKGKCFPGKSKFFNAEAAISDQAIRWS